MSDEPRAAGTEPAGRVRGRGSAGAPDGPWVPVPVPVGRGPSLAAAPAPAIWPVGFEELYREWFVPLVRVAALLTGSAALAEEIVQEAFVRCRGALDEVDKPAAYLRTAVVNGCRSHHRRRILALGLAPRIGTLSEASEPEMHELADVLRLLPVRQRTVLVLRYYADLSEAEIAEVLGCRPGTVKSLSHRGLRRLRELMELA